MSTKQEEEIDIDLNDPEVEVAATKIQAAFKGMQTRREMKVTKDTEQVRTVLLHLVMTILHSYIHLKLFCSSLNVVI